MGNKNEIGKLFCRIINKQDYEKFDNLYLFFAMKKSGQHPIINWINEHTTPSVLYNDCRIFDNSLYYTIKKLYSIMSYQISYNHCIVLKVLYVI